MGNEYQGTKFQTELIDKEVVKWFKLKICNTGQLYLPEIIVHQLFLAGMVEI